MIMTYEIFNTSTGETLALTDNETIRDIIITNLERLGAPYDWHYTDEWLSIQAEIN